MSKKLRRLLKKLEKEMKIEIDTDAAFERFAAENELVEDVEMDQDEDEYKKLKWKNIILYGSILLGVISLSIGVIVGVSLWNKSKNYDNNFAILVSESIDSAEGYFIENNIQSPLRITTSKLIMDFVVFNIYEMDNCYFQIYSKKENTEIKITYLYNDDQETYIKNGQTQNLIWKVDTTIQQDFEMKFYEDNELIHQFSFSI